MQVHEIIRAEQIGLAKIRAFRKERIERSQRVGAFGHSLRGLWQLCRVSNVCRFHPPLPVFEHDCRESVRRKCMISRTPARRLDALEAEVVPMREPHIIRVEYIGDDGEVDSSYTHQL